MREVSEKIRQLASEADASWGADYGLFGKVIAEKTLETGAEIGVAFGGHAESLLSIPTIKKLYGIDPYLHRANYDDPTNVSQEEFDQIYKFASERLAREGARYQLIRKSSAEAHRDMPELDFVYLGANHSYEGVWEDLCIWFPRVRAGGIIGGHDYSHPNFKGVKEAVDQFFKRFGWQISVEGRVWSVEKKELNISFFMPAYNCAATIEQSVESIMSENFVDGDELVVVDDCSSDGTGDVLRKLTTKYPQIRTFRHKHNKGGGAARNTAIENTRGPLVFCLDSDNVLVPGSIQRLKIFLENSGADSASFSELFYFKEDIEQVTHKWTYQDGLVSLSDHLSTIAVPGASGNYLFTKEDWLRAGGYPEFARALDAWGFGFRQLATGSRMAVMPESHYFHRYGYESYWVRESKTAQLSLTALQILVPFSHMINKRDLNRIMGPNGRYNWFDEIEKRPVRVRDGESHTDRPPQKKRLLQMVSRAVPRPVKAIIRGRT